MRIFINALSARLGGGQTYLINLLRLVPQDRNIQIFVLVQPSFQLAGLPQNVIRIERQSLGNPFVRAIWEELFLPSLLKSLKIDLFFSPGGLLPRRLPIGMQAVVTFQNMLPFDLVQRAKYPYGYRRFRDWLLERGLSAAMRRSNLVIFISNFAKDFIKRTLGELPGKSIVVPHGIHPAFRLSSEGGLRRPNWVPQSDYFLYVSFIDFYKSQLEVVRGFDMYLRRGGAGQLLLVGAEYRHYGDLVRDEIVKLGLQDKVIMIGNVPHDELPAAYQNAKVNIFASLTENCPNILLEIMASGRPALVSDRPPMPEFGGGAVEYFNPSSPEDFANRLEQLMGDEEKQSRLGKIAKEHVVGWDWDVAADSTWTAISNINE